jgi:aldehyde:ferredoxin oxidoreductase
LVIGPSGERLSRIATIQTASSSAAGQGGFGGVMGSKRLARFIKAQLRATSTLTI